MLAERLTIMDEMEPLGKYLRKERELKKVSLGELSTNTRVRGHILKAIEEDRYDLLPSPTFVKGFLTSYAKYVGIDPNDVVHRYQVALRGQFDTGSDVPPKREIRRHGKSLQHIGGFIVGGIIVAGLTIAYFFSIQPSKPSAQPVPVSLAAKDAPPSISLSSPPGGEGDVEEGDGAEGDRETSSDIANKNPQEEILFSPTQIVGANSFQKGKPISLQLKAIETTWLSAKVDDQTGRDMILRPGESIPLEAINQIDLLVGNAGGLDFIQNEKGLERFGKSGEVVALTFTPQRLAVKRFEKSKPKPSEVPQP